jgi:hypothetical protein
MSNFLTEETTKGLNLNPDIDSFDIPKDEYQKILNGMFMAFLGKVKDCDSEATTEAYCRRVLKQCSSCFKEDGKIWRKPPGRDAADWYEKLALRLRIFGYDISTQSLIGRRESKISSKIKDLNKRDKKDIDPNDRTFTMQEQVMFDDFKEKFRADFPSSATAADDLMIERLAFLSVLNARDIKFVSLSRDLTKEIKDLAESLGVSGKQRQSTMRDDKSGTLEQLSTKFRKTLEEHIEIESMWKAEEMKLIVNAVERGTTEEFLAMSWYKILYGGMIGDKPATYEGIKKFIKKRYTE